MGAVGIAATVVDGILNTPCEPSILFPRSGGNIHSFTALTPCALLDVLSPPYSEEHGRPSTYYAEFPISDLPGNCQFMSCFLDTILIILIKPKFMLLLYIDHLISSYGPGYTFLEERDLPSDLVVIGAPYLGPPIITRDDLC